MVYMWVYGHIFCKITFPLKKIKKIEKQEVSYFFLILRISNDFSRRNKEKMCNFIKNVNNEFNQIY